MNSFIDFIFENWRLICDIFAVIVSFILLIVKKKPCINTVDTIKEFILEVIPLFVSAVELPGVSGEQKKAQVIDTISKLILKKFGVSADSFFDFISESIENVLKTPQKKGI